MATINNELVLVLNKRRAKVFLAKAKKLHLAANNQSVLMEVADYTVGWFSRPTRRYAWEMSSMDLLRLQVILEQYISRNTTKELKITRKYLSGYPIYSKKQAA